MANIGFANNPSSFSFGGRSRLNLDYNYKPSWAGRTQMSTNFGSSSNNYYSPSNHHSSKGNWFDQHPAITNAGASLLSSGANLVNEWQNRREQRRINKRNEELWREQQEYNDPSNQMLRLQRAGLNPMLIYGGGAASAAGNAGAPPSMQSYQTGIPDAVGSIMTLLMQVAQLQQLEHQNKLIDSQASLAATQAQYYDEMVRNKSINTKTQVYNLSVAQDRGTKTNEGMPTVNQVGGNLLQKLSVRILRWLKNA